MVATPTDNERNPGQRVTLEPQVVPDDPGLALVAVRWLGAGLAAVWLMYTITTHVPALSYWIVLRRRLAAYRFTGP